MEMIDLPDEIDFVVAPTSYDNNEAAAFAHGWNACREAMKQKFLSEETTNSCPIQIINPVVETPVESDTGTQAAAAGGAHNAGIVTS